MKKIRLIVCLCTTSFVHVDDINMFYIFLERQKEPEMQKRISKNKRLGKDETSFYGRKIAQEEATKTDNTCCINDAVLLP